MALNITAEQYAVVQSYAASGNYIGGWAYLSSVGDRYADNAYAVTSGTATGADKGFEVLVKTHWDMTAGAGAYDEKFDAVARQHFQQYVEAIDPFDGYKLPDSGQIEQSYRDAIIENGLPPSTAIDGVITRSFGELMDKAWPGSKDNGLDWTDGVGMEDARQVPSTVFDDINPVEAGRTLVADMIVTVIELRNLALVESASALWTEALESWGQLEDMLVDAYVEFVFDPLKGAASLIEQPRQHPLQRRLRLAPAPLRPPHPGSGRRWSGDGGHQKVALVACMRKLLVIINTMLKNDTVWNPKIATTAA